MELDVYAILKASPVLVLFLILGIGILAGKLTIAKVTVGSVSGVLLAGLFFGHLGLDVPTVSHDIGFLLFIYCIGAQAGPQFLRVFREDGSRYAWLSLVTAATGMWLAVEIGAYFEFEPGVAAGVLAGALTSTPTLVAAQDAMTNMGSLPGDFPVSEALENISAAYAITYVFGIAGLIAFLTLMPRVLRLDVAAEAQALSEKKGFGINPRGPQVGAPVETPKIHAYRIDRSVADEIYADHETLPGEIQKVKRGDEVFTPDWDTRLQQGDVISLVGLESAHQFVRDRLGPEVIDHDVLDRSVESRSVLVTRGDVAGKTLAEMPFGGGQSVWLTELTRSGVPMPRRADLELHIGDVLLLTGPRSKLDEVADGIGEAENELHQTDLVALAFGIALGVFFGMVGFKIGETYVGLGSAGGVMLVGLLFGLINSYRPSFGRLPEGARYVLTELGLLLFMAGVAVSAGREIVEMLMEAGPKLALVGMVITLVPVSLSFLLGRYVFKMNAALLLGAMSGAMTSTGALQQISAQARSSVPMLGYVGTYAFANVLLTIAGGVVARF